MAKRGSNKWSKEESAVLIDLVQKNRAIWDTKSKIQFTVRHAETKRHCHKVSASDVFRCAESPAHRNYVSNFWFSACSFLVRRKTLNWPLGCGKLSATFFDEMQ